MGFHLSALQLGPLEGVFANGYRGVVVFFVLSGFLVARPFVAGPVPVGRYLLRRGARVYAVDRARMHADIAEDPRLVHVRESAFTWRPPKPASPRRA